ncbi:unnamed protein product [Peniophora sp. CBMAI 1063]|nr:unnamed protein product [Peniophora sp. CBMAI 1063]
MAIPSGSSTLKLPMPPTGQGRPSMFSIPSFNSGRGARSGKDSPLPEDVSEAARLLSRSGTVDDQGGTYGAVEDSESQKAPSTPRYPGQRVPLSAKARYYIPSLEWIPNYSLSYLGGDILAGVTVAAMLIPQSVSYATSLARLSPTTGLFAAAIPPLVYALLGTSRQLNVAPEAALSLIVGQTIQSILHNDPHTHPIDPATLSLIIASVIVAQVGLISFVLGFFRLGFIDVVLSRALLRGFITAIAIVIAIEQLIPMLGLVALEHKVNPETTLQKFLFLVEYGFTHAHKPTVLLSFISFAILVAIRNLKRFVSHIPILYRMPEVLLVVLGSTFLCYKFDWDEMGIDILGEVKFGGGAGYIHFPLKHTALKYVHETTSAAVLISIIGFLDSIVAAKQNAARFGYTISPNRELVALGAANLAASFVPGTLPAWGSITRSKINADVGGRTQMASIVCAVLVLLATFFLLPFLYYLPKCVLAAIICMVVLSLLGETPEDIHYYYTMRSWVDLGLMTLTFVLTMIWNVQVGVVVSVIVSLLLVVRRSSRTRMTILGHVPGTDSWKPLNEHPAATEDLPGVLIVRLRESLDFANTAQLKERLRRLELYGTDPSHPSEAPRRQQARVLVFHMADVESADASAVMILKELFKEYKARDVDVHITHLRWGPYRAFEKAGVVKLLGEEAFHEDVATAAGNISRVASEANIAGR